MSLLPASKPKTEPVRSNKRAHLFVNLELVALAAGFPEGVRIVGVELAPEYRPEFGIARLTLEGEALPVAEPDPESPPEKLPTVDAVFQRAEGDPPAGVPPIGWTHFKEFTAR